MREENRAVLLILRVGDFAMASPLVLTIRTLTLSRLAYAALLRTTQVLALLRVVLVRLTQSITELLRRPACASERITVVFLYGRTTHIGALGLAVLTLNELALPLRFERHIAYASLLGLRFLIRVRLVRRQLSLRRLTFATLVLTPVVLTLSGVSWVDLAQLIHELILCRGQSAQPQGLS